MEARENMSAGVTVIGAEAPSNYHVAARTENMAGNPTVVEPPMAAGVAETMGKKKRGRPRKYGPDGALSRALSPIPISSSAPPASTGNFSANKRGRGRPIGSENKQKEKMDLDNSGDLVDCSAGTNFMTHMITVNKGEDENRHAGDLGNITVGADGTACFTIVDKQIPLCGPNSIIGRAVVVHGDPDDLAMGCNGQCATLFVIIAGGYLGFKIGWVGYELPVGYFPFGVNGMLAGAATVFFAYIGFDSVASTAEEVKNPQRDLPLGAGLYLTTLVVSYIQSLMGVMNRMLENLHKWPRCDITMKIISFTKQGPRAICIISAIGLISNATLRHPDSSGATLTYEGIFEIITLSGSFTPTEVGANRVGRMGGLNVCLSSPDGRVIGGTLAGLLVAGGPVQVVAASFLPSGYQEQKKPKKQKTNPNPTPNAPTSAAVFPPNADNDRYSTPEQNNSAAPKPNLSSSSIHTTNWASMEATPDFRKSATDINISWQGE
ncbi:unnamed protein product [Camellia sinensis]